MELKDIYDLFAKNGVFEVYIKILSPNDNSKNQIYLSEEFLTILPAHESSLKERYSKKKSKHEYIFHNSLNFSWIINNKISPAPNTKLIFYPQYPEARLSGFLAGSHGAPSDLLASRSTEKRVLFLGSNSNRESFGAVILLTDSLIEKINSECTSFRKPKKDQPPVFFYKELYESDPVSVITNALREIYQMGWVKSCKLKNGIKEPYNAKNGGGYTLEAHLGITPNSKSDPDYMGWEVKQHGLKNRIITLMTPDPDIGFAALEGTKEFVMKYGYPDRSGKPNRKNFGGVYKNRGNFHHLTNLNLSITGFHEGEITDSKGSVSLIDKEGLIVAGWTFEKLMVHWTRKHAKAVFMPSENKVEERTVYYRYLKNISLGQQSSFLTFLDLIDKGLIYLDPALKCEIVENKEEIKTRYQFRINKKNLPKLYKKFEDFLL